MAVQPIAPTQNPSIDALFSRNATKVNVAVQLPGGTWARVGRVQSISEDIANNVQVLTELGSQVAVELKKGITTYTFSIAKMYVRTDVFDQLRGGAIFGLMISDDSGIQPDGSGGSSVILEQFSQCSITSISRSFTNGQATVAQNASVVTIGGSMGSPD
jgi:hypothetical protein